MLFAPAFCRSHWDRDFDKAWDQIWDKPLERRDLMKTNISEKEDGYTLSIEVPGYQKEDLAITLKEGCMTITATKEENKEEKDEDGHLIREERFCGTCARSFYVGDAVTEEDIKASYKDGILTLTVPKKEKALPETKTITIA